MVVLTDNMPHLESASLGVWVKAGARSERKTEHGISHLLEHMAFKGTARRTALQIAEEIESVGGDLNAATSVEYTCYTARVLGQDLPLAVDILADILTQPSLTEEELAREKGVILQEIGQAHDTPDDVIFDWLQEQAYPDQPIGRTILGEAARVQGFDRGDLAGFVNEHYGPDQMILSAAGAVDHDALVKQAEALFGDMVPRSALSADPARFHGGETRHTRDLEQAHLALAFEAPGYRDPEFYAAQIYSVALGGGMSSRLFQEIREKRGLCYTIFAQNGAYADTGMTTIYAGTSGAEMPELITLTVDEMKRSAEDMSSAEIERARAQMKAGLLMGLESPSSRAERSARMVQIWGEVPDIERTVAKIDAVTREDVLRFAEAQAAEAAAAMALYGPVAEAPTLSELQARRAA